MSTARLAPGLVRDAIIEFLQKEGGSATIAQISAGVCSALKRSIPDSSIRSYLRLNVPGTFLRTGMGLYQLQNAAVGRTTGPVDSNLTGGRITSIRKRTSFGPTLFEAAPPNLVFKFGRAELFQNDCLDWLRGREERSIHAVVTDPPYGLVEYSNAEQSKLRRGRGGVWRIPPSFDGCKRSPVPRFTTLTPRHMGDLLEFFTNWGRCLRRTLVPGAHVFVASNPLVSYAVAKALVEVGLERRGEIIRLVMTLRGGDRPKNAHEEFPDVSVMPRSMWEPWLLFREPLEGRVQDNLRRWKTGALRRNSPHQPFGDVIESSPTRKGERAIAPHPSLKPQSFLRQIVRAALPLGEGVILDPFAGAGSTLAACEHVGYASIGVEMDEQYIELAKKAMPRLAMYHVRASR
jgi:site-specific DNA-methyltransferase (adenine-specific)